MAYRDILVHVPLQSFEGQIEVAVALAKDFSAHLTGICSLPETAMLRSALESPFLYFDKEDVEKRVAAEYARAAVAEAAFAAAAKQAGVSFSWIVAEGDPADVLVHGCRLCDLAVVEQIDEASELLWGPVVQLALSGYPTLVVPNAWRGPVLPRKALIAWNGSAQAAAAVRGALPLLMRAEAVTVIQGPSRESFPAAMRVPPTDITAYLQRHGIKAAIKEPEVPDHEAGETIMATAKAVGADLVVMGAFGRSRFREWVLGGATRYVLEHPTMPVFMAH
jgi:nucleotide-binding universal stress UspA family protein